jgi:hypothetical protein
MRNFMPGMGKNLRTEGKARKVALRFGVIHYSGFVLHSIIKLKIKTALQDGIGPRLLGPNV